MKVLGTIGAIDPADVAVVMKDFRGELKFIKRADAIEFLRSMEEALKANPAPGTLQHLSKGEGGEI